MNHYDTLGISRDASAEQIRHAYLAKISRLSPERFEGSTSDVAGALAQASRMVDVAWRVLGNPASRAEYDSELAADPTVGSHSRRAHAEHVWVMERELDWPLSPAFGLSPPNALSASAPARKGAEGNGSEDGRTGSEGGLARQASYPSRGGDVSPIFGSLEALADWLGPHPRVERNVVVPDVCGMRASEAFDAVALADLQIHFVRLTENPEGGDGTVVDQDPPAGMSVRRHSSVTVQVVYPAGSPRAVVP